jgi:hypothetical protein
VYAYAIVHNILYEVTARYFVCENGNLIVFPLYILLLTVDLEYEKHRIKLRRFGHEITDLYRPLWPTSLRKQMKLLTALANAWKYW